MLCAAMYQRNVKRPMRPTQSRGAGNVQGNVSPPVEIQGIPTAIIFQMSLDDMDEELDDLLENIIDADNVKGNNYAHWAQELRMNRTERMSLETLFKKNKSPYRTLYERFTNNFDETVTVEALYYSFRRAKLMRASNELLKGMTRIYRSNLVQESDQGAPGGMYSNSQGVFPPPPVNYFPRQDQGQQYQYQIDRGRAPSFSSQPPPYSSFEDEKVEKRGRASSHRMQLNSESANEPESKAPYISQEMLSQRLSQPTTDSQNAKLAFASFGSVPLNQFQNERSFAHSFQSAPSSNGRPHLHHMGSSETSVFERETSPSQLRSRNLSLTSDLGITPRKEPTEDIEPGRVPSESEESLSPTSARIIQAHFELNSKTTNPFVSESTIEKISQNENEAVLTCFRKLSLQENSRMPSDATGAEQRQRRVSCDNSSVRFQGGNQIPQIVGSGVMGNPEHGVQDVRVNTCTPQTGSQVSVPISAQDYSAMSSLEQSSFQQEAAYRSVSQSDPSYFGLYDENYSYSETVQSDVSARAFGTYEQHQINDYRQLRRQFQDEDGNG